MKIDRVGILAFIGVIAFIAIDPLTLGQAFYQLLVTFTTNELSNWGSGQSKTREESLAL